MERNNYLKNSEKEIMQLKSDLLNGENNSFDSFSYDFYEKQIFEQNKMFDENLKNALQLEFGWEKKNIENYSHYRIVEFNKKEYVLMREGKITLKINGEKYFIKSNSENIIIKKGKNLMKKNDNNCNEIREKISEKNLIIKKEKEIQTNGYFHIENFYFSLLNTDFSILYKNIDDEELEQVTEIFIETKLNKREISELISRIKENKKIFEKITDEKILFIGLVGNSEKEQKIMIDMEAELSGIRCLILEMKTSDVLGRNMRYYLDWKTIRDVEKQAEDIKKLKEYVKRLEAFIDKIKRNMKDIKNALPPDLWNDIKALGKKRSRSKQKDN